MKICRIIYAYAPHRLGGADIYTEKIQKELTSNGYPSVVITINPKKGNIVENYDNLKIYRIQSDNISTFHTIGKASILQQGLWTVLDIYSSHTYKKIREILTKEKPDIVHLHTPIDVTLSAFAAVKSLNLPLVFTLHDYLLLCRRIVLLHGSGKICTNANIQPLCLLYRSLVRRLVNNKVDVVIAPSDFVLKMHKINGFFNNVYSVTLPHGIELNNKIIKKVNNEYFNILYVGGLIKSKGVDVLINAVRMINYRNIRLRIVGGGIYERKLIKLAEKDKRIIFYGKLTNEEVQKFYFDSDILVVPSIWYDVRPNVIPEAFRAGLPVIASRIGGIPELVKDDFNGFLFDPDDVKMLKETIERCITNPQLLRSLAENAKEFVKQFEMGNYVKKLIEVYGRAIEVNKLKIPGKVK